MVQSVEGLGQIVGKLRHHRGAVGACRLLHRLREAVKCLNQFLGPLVDDHLRPIPGRASALCFAQNGLDACVAVLNERTSVAVEINGLFGVEHHSLSRIYLQNKVLKGSVAQNAVELSLLGFAEPLSLAKLFTQGAGRGLHFVQQVVGVDYGAFARLHFSTRKVHHSVTQVVKLVGPGVAQLFEN